MGKTAVPIWGEMYDAFKDAKASNFTYGTVHDQPLVVFKGAYDGNGGKFPSWGSKLSLEINYGIDKDFYPLTSSCSTVFFIQERIFDRFLEESGINADLAEYREKLFTWNKDVCVLKAKEFNTPTGLSQDDADVMARLEKKIKDYQDKTNETHSKVFTFYEQFMGSSSRYQAFQRTVEKLLNTEGTFERHKYELVAEAYEKDSSGASNGIRRPELDHTNDDDPTASHVLVWKVEEKRYEEQAKYEKDKTAFEAARKLHRVQIMGNKYHVAEAQRAYLKNNLKLPAVSCGVSARILLGVIQNISEHMYLLPSMKDHPQLANNPEVVAANVPLTKMEVCAILKRAMSKRAVTQYEAKRNSDCPAEFDPDAMAAEFDRIMDQLSFEDQDKKKNNGGGDKPQANSNSAQKRGNGGARPSSNGQSSGKVCKRCKQHHPDKERLWKSHATADCKKYDQDNKPIPQDGKGKGTPQKRVYALEKDDEEYTPRHRSSKKKKKSKEKKKKKKTSSKRKKRSRSRSSSRGGSSSSSSASGSSFSSSE